MKVDKKNIFSTGRSSLPAQKSPSVSCGKKILSDRLDLFIRSGMAHQGGVPSSMVRGLAESEKKLKEAEASAEAAKKIAEKLEAELKKVNDAEEGRNRAVEEFLRITRDDEYPQLHIAEAQRALDAENLAHAKNSIQWAKDGLVWIRNLPCFNKEVRGMHLQQFQGEIRRLEEQAKALEMGIHRDRENSQRTRESERWADWEREGAWPQVLFAQAKKCIQEKRFDAARARVGEVEGALKAIQKKKVLDRVIFDAHMQNFRHRLEALEQCLDTCQTHETHNQRMRKEADERREQFQELQKNNEVIREQNLEAQKNNEKLQGSFTRLEERLHQDRVAAVVREFEIKSQTRVRPAPCGSVSFSYGTGNLGLPAPSEKAEILTEFFIRSLPAEQWDEAVAGKLQPRALLRALHRVTKQFPELQEKIGRELDQQEGAGDADGNSGPVRRTRHPLWDLAHRVSVTMNRYGVEVQKRNPSVDVEELSREVRRRMNSVLPKMAALVERCIRFFAEQEGRQETIAE